MRRAEQAALGTQAMASSWTQRRPAVDRLLDNGVEIHDADSGQGGVPMEAFWESFRLDPRQPGHASMRASDADREIVRAVLADAYADSRLTREEYDDRLNTLYGSRTLGEMPSLVTDLGWVRRSRR